MLANGRSIKAAVTGLLLAGSVSAPVASASEAGCRDQSDPQPTRTFDVRVRAAEDVYELGETARFPVKVSRVLHGQVIGPAEGAQVGVFLALGDVTLFDSAVTDAEGTAVVKVRLRRYAPTGLADVTAIAQKQTVDLPCNSQLEREFGDVEVHGLFRVVR